MSTNTSNGFTLLEMLFSLAIVGILMAGVANANFGSSRESTLADRLMTDVMSALSMTRSYAIDEAMTVTFCRSVSGRQCGGAWDDGAIIFTDFNEDRRLNGDDRLIFRLQSHDVAGRLSFNSFQNRQYLQINSRGFTKYQNGNFTFCAADGDPTKHRQIILSLTGRTRFARDEDGDGVVENSQGNPLKCKN